MDCNTPVTWENIIRPAIRILNDGCTAIAIDTASVPPSGAFDCDELPMLTKVAMAVTDGIFNATFSDGDSTAHDCTDLPFLPLETLLGYVMLPGAAPNTSVFLLHDSDDAGDCGMTCAEAELSTEDLFRRTLVSTPIPNEWNVLVAFVGEGFMTCDDSELPTETLLRSAFVDLGDGTYAIRVVQEVA